MFLCEDIVTYTNFDNADIIIIRDVIFHLKNEEILSIFENIYKHQIWNNGDSNIPLSGPGSSLLNTNKCSTL